ncbi:MAG: fibronectin type III domain-containing protein [Bacteroidales bacterium]
MDPPEKAEGFTVYNSWDFENESIGSYTDSKIEQDFSYTILYSHNSASIVIDTINNIPTKVMRITHKANTLADGLEMNVNLETDYYEVYLSYNWKFSEEFNSTSGGKLPGLGGLPDFGNNCPEGIEGFRAHNMFKRAGKIISYHYDRTERSYDDCPWSTSDYNFNNTYLSNGVWYNITQRLVINSFTNGVANSDGIKELWIDGRLIYQETNLKLMETEAENMKIDAFRLSNFYGGETDNYKPLYECYGYIDNIRIYLPSGSDVTGHELHSPSEVLTTPDEITDRRVYYDELITDPGNLRNSDYGSNYGNCIDEAYLIDAGEGNSITFKWDHNISTGDYLFFYNGNTTDAPLLRMIGSSNQTDQTIKSTGRYLFVRFSTDRDGNAAGWNGTVTFLEVPRTPTNLQVTGSDGSSVSLSWNDNSSDEYGFEIQRAVNNDSFVKLTEVGSDVTTFTDRDITQNTEYSYRIRAYNNNGYSGYSNVVSVFIPSGTALPLAPADLHASYVSGDRVELEWTDVSDNESGFEIQKAPDNNPFTKTADVSADVTSFTDYNVLPETECTFRVRAFNSEGNSAFSNSVTVTVPAEGNPNAPRNLAASYVGSNRIDLEWIDMADDETGFELHRADSSKIFNLAGMIDSNTMHYIDTSGIRPSAWHYYLLQAYNEHGYSLFTDTLRVLTQDGVRPEPPDQLSVSGIDQDHISLNWNDNSPNETGFVIKRATYPSENFKIIHTTSQNSSAYLDEQVFPGETYLYTVSAINEAGESNNSNQVRISTLVLIDTMRIKKGLIAEYIFSSDSDSFILDRSGYNKPLDLMIQDPDKIEMTPNGKLKITSGTRLSSREVAVKISNACKQTNEITVECWLKCKKTQSQYHSKVLAIENYSSQAFALNVYSEMYGPGTVTYSTNLSTATTDAFGNPGLTLNTGLDADVLQHIVYTHNASGEEKIFVNGEELISGFRPAKYNKWENDYSLLIANSFHEDAPWLGDIYLLSIYDRFLTSDEIRANYLASPFSNLDYVLNSHEYELHLFPNPAGDHVTLTFSNPNQNAEITERYFIRILDIYGKVVYMEDVTSKISNDSFELDISSFNSGVYSIVLFNHNEVIDTRKLMVLD